MPVVPATEETIGRAAEALGLERQLDGAQTVSPFRVAIARVMLEAGGMSEQQRGHGQCIVTGRLGRITLA